MEKEINKSFKSKMDNISKQIDITKKYSFDIRKNKNNNYIIEFIDDNKVALKAECFIAGFYNVHNSFWYWAWSADNIDRKLSNKSKSIKEYGTEIQKKLESTKKEKELDYEFLEKVYFRTTNGGFYLVPESIEHIIKLAMYITGGLWIATMDEGKRMEYYIITKIL